jgi:hypothetical protein
MSVTIAVRVFSVLLAVTNQEVCSPPIRDFLMRDSNVYDRQAALAHLDK